MLQTAVASRRRLQAKMNDVQKCAEAVNLIYVSDNEPGIKRQRRGKGYIYLYCGKKVTDEKTLRRIRSLVIPPAWKDVWICYSEHGHIQCTGLDAMSRKQYRYHNKWVEFRNENKFSRLREFGESLPVLRLQVEKDLAQQQLTEEKVIASAISIMERTYIRIGNNIYEKLYGSYGLTTLKDNHVKINGDNISFAFKGKKNIAHTITLKNKRLARIVKQCKDIPGKELFQYITSDGLHHPIDSGKVNAYIKKVTGKDFTAKDFRTWAGTINALSFFCQAGSAETIADTKKKIVQALDYVSKKLGNSRTVCKKYYVHPVVLQMYETSTLDQYVKDLDRIEKTDNKSGLAPEEQLLMKILEKNQNT
jgi:DNA topoisomerase I